MRKVYQLSTCTTCQTLINQLNLADSFEIIDIKANKISPEELDYMKELIGSYEALFSRRAMKFRMMGLHEQKLTEEDFRRLILEEYTFLKRPIILLDDQIYIGNSKKTIDIVSAQLRH